MADVLSSVKKKKTVIIESIDTKNTDVVEELEVLGFIPGTPTTVLSESIFSGPITLLLRGAKVAIRKHEADCIAVSA
jgi:Fe2+ transport system protein FeoA